MTEMNEKKGKLKITIEVEVNEELYGFSQRRNGKDANANARNVEDARRRKERVSPLTTSKT